jgi:hypothetical protein
MPAQRLSMRCGYESCCGCVWELRRAIGRLPGSSGWRAARYKTIWLERRPPARPGRWRTSSATRCSRSGGRHQAGLSTSRLEGSDPPVRPLSQAHSARQEETRRHRRHRLRNGRVLVGHRSPCRTHRLINGGPPYGQDGAQAPVIPALGIRQSTATVTRPFAFGCLGLEMEPRRGIPECS